MDKIPTFPTRSPTRLLRQIGANLRSHRKALGWSQAELAERAGVSLSTLKLLEREGKGSLQRLAKIATILNIDSELMQLFSATPTYTSLDEVEETTKKR